MTLSLDFERPIQELESKIEELKRLDGDAGVDIQDEIVRLQEKVEKQLRATYKDLSAWQKTQVARHPDRPHCVDVIGRLVEDFTPLAGDRKFGEDKAIVAGLGRFNGRGVVVIGQEKGRTTNDRVKHNFGMAKPEGYRKAARVMEMADKFGLPVLTFIDTPGAYPGIQAEERGQAEAIAPCTQTCLRLGVPIVASILGEGGSGGAIALAAADRVLMMEHSIYSVISPEGCASILWHSADKAQDAAEALRLTSGDLRELGVIDQLVPEPLGGAQRDQAAAIDNLGKTLEGLLSPLEAMSAEALRAARHEKFLAMGRNLPQ